MIALQDQLSTAPLPPLADHAFGSAVVAIDGGAMLVSVSGANLTPPANWIMAGGIWNDAAQWNDAALWEDS